MAVLFSAALIFSIGLMTLPRLTAPVRVLIPYLARPQLVLFYAFHPAMRDLIHLLAENRLQAFQAVWDTSEGVLLSKKMFRPIDMNGESRYGYLPHLKKLSFQTGLPDFQRNFEAPDSPRLRSILKKLDTRFEIESVFNAYGFRQTQYDFEKGDRESILFTGDSFTEGLWVDDQTTFVNQYAQRLNQGRSKKISVINSGTNGYGALEESFIAQKYGPEFRYRTLFLIHYPNDIHRETYAVMGASLPDLEVWWTEHFKILQGLAEFARQNKIRLILIPIPPKEQLAMPETRKNYQDKLRVFCRQNEILFLDPFETFCETGREHLYFDWDPHLNPQGHRVLTDFIWRGTKGFFEKTPRN